ncbi:MAG: prepilin-type N-terminal cleavage/methylation domain-containing protein [Deltaproteobacteria bacterium]|nr:prepilin-type N-terminal cleavage/methylation domain-containing protein [Deltaproteobacteria bacterium]
MRAQRGFTIIELMIVVVIIGILAAVAIPMFMNHMNRSKASEAMLQLNKMAIDAKTYYFANTKYPQGTAAVLPGADGAACASANKRFAVSSAWAADSVWLDLGFQVDEPNMFSYHFTSNSLTQAQGLAVGDMDCDGTKITYILNLNAAQEPAATYIQPPPSAD